jgi:hypothetical protein
MWNRKNADEPKPIGAESEPAGDETDVSDCPSVADQPSAGKSHPPQTVCGFSIQARIAEVTILGTFGRPLRFRVLRVDMAPAKRIEFGQHGIIVRGAWRVSGFCLN